MTDRSHSGVAAQAFICVYRHSRPKASELRATTVAAAKKALVRKFLEHYDDEDCYYGWGDDPLFQHGWII
jgi:hypothetical protein